MSAKVLVVEDEELVGTMVRINLESEGYTVTWVRDGGEGLRLGSEGGYDLILLDISLPGLSGLEVLEQLRATAVSTPVLMLTARSEVATKVSALDLGADDYLTKPFDVPELVARVRVLTRRARRDTPAAGEGEVNRR